VKAFAFRLEQVLRWRDTQVSLQKARVAAAAGQVAQLKTLLELRHAELAAGSAGVTREPTGTALLSYAGFVAKSHLRIRENSEQLLAAQRALGAETDRLIEANRKLRLLADLRQSGREAWRKEHDRELAAFADEAFLGRIHSKAQSGKRTGA